MESTTPRPAPDLDAAAAAFHRGLAQKSAGLLEDAVLAFRHAAALAPGEAAAPYNLAGTLLALGRAAEAEAACRAALALQPGWAEAHNRLGGLLQGQGRLAEAQEAFRRAAELRPDWFLPHHNLGQAAMAEGDDARAAACFREAIRREPAFPQSHLDLGGLLLKAGELEEGWREYEWRFARGGDTPGHPCSEAPVWDGSPLGGRVIMVWHEQGLGDHLQFCRYAAELHRRGGRVWLQVPGPLRRLAESLEGVERLVAPGEEPEGFDVQAPLLSLPRLCGTTLDSLPALAGGVPYLAAPACAEPALLELAREPRRGLRVGIVWASAPGNPAAARRDCPPAKLARLAGVPGVSLYSLQFGERARDLRDDPGLPVRDLSGVLGDFATTAAFVGEMDLVVTVDTAMAHLAGALGRKAWILLSEPADWRWLEGRDDSPWYPSLRLFRQPAPGDWDGVVAAVGNELRKEAAGLRGPRH